MQNIVINIHETFHNDRLRNDRALGGRKSDNNKNPKNNNKNNVRSAWRPVFWSKKAQCSKFLPNVVRDPFPAGDALYKSTSPPSAVVVS